VELSISRFENALDVSYNGDQPHGEDDNRRRTVARLTENTGITRPTMAKTENGAPTVFPHVSVGCPVVRGAVVT
jgi:hypothetical protein